MNVDGLNKLKSKPNDLIYTPLELSKKLIDIVPIKKEDVLLDAFKGSGSFFNQFPITNKKEWCEIEEGIDFFSYNKKVDWIISNPPFSEITKIIKKSSAICQIGFAYIFPLMSFNYSRLKLIQESGFFIYKFVLFENPKQWNIGFPHAFIIFTKKQNNSIILCDKIKTLQSKLF
jgi:hypothetical protein